jgi:hypothetical protein
MAPWPSNWKQQVLASAGIEPTVKSLKAISAWQASTPLDPWTNNPLGMPAKLGAVAKVPGTQYAMFKSITDFYTAFSQFMKSSLGGAIKDALTSDDGYGPVWRAIAATDWPASATETDWPAKVLDLAGQAYIDSVGASGAAQRKSAGKPKAAPAVHEAMRQQAQSVVHATAAFKDATTATRFLIARHTRYGK